jgi:EAL domain-containing protein (putative c-di-GMP-specific phosphodiesterase class I)
MQGESSAVVRAIIALADSLGIEAIAEGVETAVQRDCLRALNCRYAQGYWFGWPAAL